ncbi:MAG: Gfo/Idh/MocA family protein, partial [Acidimicrobiales bacterium]
MARTRNDIGIGVIGIGKIGVQRARLAALHPAVDFLAVMDLDRQRAEAVGREVEADLVAETMEELVSDDRIDAVVISTAEPFHTEPALAAIGAGKPVLIEKPLAMTLDDANRIVAASKAEGVDVRVGYSMRYLQKYSVG